MSKPPRILILDACALSDLSQVDRRVLKDVCRAVGSVHVRKPVFDEVERIDEPAAAAVGFAIIEPELEDLLGAAHTPGGALSFQDRLSLLVAARRRWTCVSNDKPLRAACAARGVPVLWALEMLGLAAPKVTLARLEMAAWAIHAKNPRHVPKKLVEAFLTKLRRK